MTIVNKLNMVNMNSVASLTQVKKTGSIEGSSLRQGIAESGKTVPVQQGAVSPEGQTKELNNAIKNLSGYVQNITRELNFSVDQDLGETVVTVVDETTGDVIRQIPTEEMLELSKHLADSKERSTKGLLFRGDA